MSRELIRRLLSIIFMFCVITGLLCSCDDIVGNESSESTSSFAESEPEVSITDESSASPAHDDSNFSETVFIKCGNASEMPNYESVFRFNSDGTMLYSMNVYSGFSQSKAQYYLKSENINKGYEIWYYYNDKKEYAVKLFTCDYSGTLCNNDDISAYFIDEEEFDRIYAFHKEWNEKTY